MGTDANHERPAGSPAASVVHSLHERKETLATVESLTGGLLSAAIVEIAGVSGIFRGGLVVYATELKSELAGVPEDLLAQRGPVDPDVAAALAEGGRRRCGADWGLATTGVAGPEPQDGKPVGLVYVAASGPDGTEVRELRLDGGRDHIRAAAVIEALRLLAERIHAAVEADEAASAGEAGVAESAGDADRAGAGQR
ncbi:CinA family protein [Micromonospora chersina]|uniref:CinA family protein n=1 Tax=Micromonospora chersina TaxID=47854 RepID=UPI00371BC5EE